MARVLVGNFKGKDGKSATIKVGRVRTVASNQPANVKNVGTTTDAIFDFDIPQGKDGTGGGTGGTNNYEELENLPSINGVELVGNKTSAELGIDSISANVIANDYNPMIDYPKGSYVIHNNKLYKKNKNGSSSGANKYMIQAGDHDYKFGTKYISNTYQWRHSVSSPATQPLYGGIVSVPYKNTSTYTYIPIYISKTNFKFNAFGYDSLDTEIINSRGREWYITKATIGNSDSATPLLATSIESGEDLYIGEFESVRDENLIDFLFGIMENEFNPLDWDEIKVMNEIQGGGGDNIYSTEEKIIGTWIDGRPVYMQVIELNNITVSSSSWTDIGVQIGNREICIQGNIITNVGMNAPCCVAFDVGTTIRLWASRGSAQISGVAHLVIKYVKKSS